MVTPLRSRKSACVRQSSRDTPSTTQSCLTNSSSWSEKSVVTRVQPGRAVLRIEVQHHVLLSLERRQVHRLHVGVGQFERSERLVPVRAWCADSMPKLFRFDNCRARSCSSRATYNRRDDSSRTARRTCAAHVSAPLLAEAPAFRAAGAAAASRGVDATSARSPRSRARDDVESRIVERRGARRETRARAFRRALSLQESDSTLLVSGVNLHAAAADALLRRFAFMPQARLDDVMVSYATPGGGVGPHVDSYDVFLLQGPGRRQLAR